jgi:hypothetical protein
MIEITLFIYLSESEFEHLFLDFVSVSVITNIYWKIKHRGIKYKIYNAKQKRTPYQVLFQPPITITTNLCAGHTHEQCSDNGSPW